MFFQIERGFFSVILFAAFFAQTCSRVEKPAVGNDRQIISQNDNKNMATSPNKNPVSSDVKVLRQKIELPVEPLEAIWLEEKLGNPNNDAPGPTDYRLTAVLKFSESDAAKIVAKVSAGKLAGGATEIEEWFPADLKNKAGQNKEINGTKYDGSIFSRAPYANGTITKIENSDYFVLKLLTF